MQDTISGELSKTAAVIDGIRGDRELCARIEAVARRCTLALQAGGKILLAGNGGSAADAQHLAAELVGRYSFDRPGVAAIALTTDTSALTAIANDFGFEQLFARQVEAVGAAGDVLIGLSTSGRSPNILAALRAARRKGLGTIGLTGRSGGEMPALCDHCLCIPSAQTPRIQEGHIVVGHILCALIERAMFPALG